jgi:hypothetical protein
MKRYKSIVFILSFNFSLKIFLFFLLYFLNSLEKLSFFSFFILNSILEGHLFSFFCEPHFQNKKVKKPIQEGKKNLD